MTSQQEMDLAKYFARDRGYDRERIIHYFATDFMHSVWRAANEMKATLRVDILRKISTMQPISQDKAEDLLKIAYEVDGKCMKNAISLQIDIAHNEYDAMRKQRDEETAQSKQAAKRRTKARKI